MKQNISVKIAGREFGLSIESEKEERIRAAVARINEEIDSLKFDYRGVDDAEILRIVLLSEEKRLVDLETESSEEHEKMLRSLETLDTELGEYLLSR
ncbi:MAG: cell division protein ZapA [Bacteroidales bacterium]|nr:cell division protein ZapA [Candidatus Cacconaster equi]